MSDLHLRSLGVEDYRAIETALLESGRGRLFLEEYAKRRRATETVTLLDALSRLEDVVQEAQDGVDWKTEIEGVRAAVKGARREVAAVERRVRRPEAERLGAAMRLLDALEARLSSAIASWSAPRQSSAAPPRHAAPAAAVDLLKRLQRMTPEERLALLR